MFDFEKWYKEVGLFITPDDDENFFQYKKRLMKIAVDASLGHLADDGR